MMVEKGRKDYLARPDKKCVACGNQVRRKYQDLLCGKCYLRKKHKERLK